MNKVLIIAGMHRSGTSLFANWMHNCGISMGLYFSEDKVGNPNGHYEDLDFLFLHMDILSKNGLDSSGLLSFHLTTKIEDSDYDKMDILIRERNDRLDSWGWKEPRTCLFLEYYKTLIPNATYIVLLREPASVVDSLIRRDLKKLKLSFKKDSYWRYLTFDLLKGWREYKFRKQFEEVYLQAWIYYNEKLLSLINYTDSANILVFSFDSIQRNQKSIFSFLTKQGFVCNETDFSNVYKDDLIKKEKASIKYVSDDLRNKASDLFKSISQKSSF